jgi:uncharacterized protein YjbI with pentapeptide repeats
MNEAPLAESGKIVSVDQKFLKDVEGGRYSNYLFTTLVAKDRRFTKTNFRYSFFENSYLRDCHFDSCDFTGCRFTNTNLSGSKFSGCKFDYSYFEKTLVEPEILDTQCPGFENLKLRFARTLRTNFQQLGDPAQPRDDLGPADVAGVDDMGHACQALLRLGAQQAVRIRNDSDPHGANVT